MWHAPLRIDAPQNHLSISFEKIRAGSASLLTIRQRSTNSKLHGDNDRKIGGPVLEDPMKELPPRMYIRAFETNRASQSHRL
jgi:hypothetical protein